MTPPISIFPNEINALGDLRGGVKVSCDFALLALQLRNLKVRLRF